MIKLSVIIPAFNEAANLESGSLEEVNQYLQRQSYEYEVLVVDDGSTDETAAQIRQRIKSLKGFKLMVNPHAGKAVTVMTGLLEAKGEVVLFTDFDQSTPLNQIEKFWPKFESGYDVVIGSRQGRQGAPVLRKIIAGGFSLLRTLILGLPFKDTQCGFKAFTNPAAQEIFKPLLAKWQKQKITKAAVNAGWDVEFLYLAKKNGLKIAEVPVSWHYVGTRRVNVISDSIDALRDMLRIRRNDLMGVYKK